MRNFRLGPSRWLPDRRAHSPCAVGPCVRITGISAVCRRPARWRRTAARSPWTDRASRIERTRSDPASDNTWADRSTRIRAGCRGRGGVAARGAPTKAPNLRTERDLVASVSVLLAAAGPASMQDTRRDQVGATSGGTLRPRMGTQINWSAFGGVAVMQVLPTERGFSGSAPWCRQRQPSRTCSRPA